MADNEKKVRPTDQQVGTSARREGEPRRSSAAKVEEAEVPGREDGCEAFEDRLHRRACQGDDREKFGYKNRS